MDQHETDWVTLLAGNDRRGAVPGTRKSPPQDLLWKASLPEAVRSSPVLREDVLYVTCRDGCLYALDSRTGRQRWTFQAAAAIDSTPSLSGNLVLFGCDDGKVYAVEVTAGRLQ